ncbi:MAG: hypothetical protein JXQ73_08860 [Phycisphaerae bacterium]|nr:hypothetical protein [Phycisphaerae bacterium]
MSSAVASPHGAAFWIVSEGPAVHESLTPTVSSMGRDLTGADSAEAYRPRRTALFEPERIVLARGSCDGQERESLIRRICGLYPRAEVVEQLDTPHNRIDLGTGDRLDVHYRGKRTLVFGEHGSAVRRARESGNTCPGYWHFSPYGFCPYDCTYCYLAATKGVAFSPTVKIFLNLPEMLRDIDRIATRIGRPTAFYVGKLQDALALDPLTGYSRKLVRFFAGHRFARMTLLTKAADVGNLLDLDHRAHTVLSWSLNPPAICEEYEANTPRPDSRIQAMAACSRAGYPVRAVIMPVIPAEGWQRIYGEFLTELVETVDLDRITLGGICSYPGALHLMEAKLGRDSAVSAAIRANRTRSRDGRMRYQSSERVEIYGHLISVIRGTRPGLAIGLCLEEFGVFEALGITSSIGRCNCVL